MNAEYVIRRLLLFVPTLLAIYTLTFFLMHATPGGPWDSTEKPLPTATRARLAKEYGLSDPVWKQYLNYLGNAVQGDFGSSYTQRSRTVSDIIVTALPTSLKLAALAMFISSLIGISLGVISAVKHNTAIDYFCTFISIVGISTPAYVLTSVLVLLMASKLHWVPTGGWDGVLSVRVFIPVIALSVGPTAVLARYTRSSMLDVLRQDYVRTARAKGLSEHVVLLVHCLRNALLPVVTIAGIIIADVATGAFFVETIYQVPGIGRFFVMSISGRDYPVILGTVLLLGATVSLMNLIVDLLYPLIDPRIAIAR